MAQSKDFDSIIPLRIYVEGNVLHHNGTSTQLVNGKISQNGLAAIQYLSGLGNAVKNALDEVKKVIVTALTEGVPVQEGNLSVALAERNNGRVSWESAYVDLAREMGLSEAEIIKRQAALRAAAVKMDKYAKVK